MILTLLRRPIALVIAAGLIFVLVLIAVSQCSSGKRAATEARLNGNQAGAAVESGADAVNTVGKAGEREDELDRKVNDAKAKIDAAPDAAAADRAGRDGLCLVAPDSFGCDPVPSAAAR